jgi:hypothetical protein
MKPLSAWPISERQKIAGVFTDIDDTLTTEGVITPEALQAYSAERLELGQQVVARAQYLGRYMQAQGSKGTRDAENLKRNAGTVMAETAVDISELLAQGKAVPESAH